MRIGRLFLKAGAVAAMAAALFAGCKAAAPRVPRTIGNEVLGALTPAALREVYRTPAFVVRRTEGGRRAAVQDADVPADARLDDTNLLVFVEGAGDTVDGFRATARLLAESPCAFPGSGDHLIVVYLKWCESTSAVAEHMNRAAQQGGAALLADMLEVHARRHPAGGRVSLVGFSAGTRVIEMALAGAAGGAADWHPGAFARVDHVVFLGSSIGSEELLPPMPIRGRFLNFVNPRDTHFGDRAAYVAPAGESANPLKLLHQATLQRRPRFGASVAGFLALPTLTAPEQFNALDALAAAHLLGGADRAFQKVNVPVPPTLVAFNLFGSPLPDDDFDDYLNQAPNHYILVGRGPSGRTDAVDFKQYRAASEEFVRDLVASAAMRGRLDRFDLKAVTKGASPLGSLPTFVPWAIFGIFEGPPPEKPVETPPENPKTPGAAKP